MSEPRLEQVDHELINGNKLAHEGMRAAIRVAQIQALGGAPWDHEYQLRLSTAQGNFRRLRVAYEEAAEHSLGSGSQREAG